MSNPIILLRANWVHMAKVSGFDPLAEALQKLDSVSCINLFSSDFNSQSRFFRLRRIVARFLRWIPPLWRWIVPASDLVTAKRASPFTSENHERSAVVLLKLLEQDQLRRAVLMAGEDQYGAVLASAPHHLRKRLIVVMHQPPSWHRLHWRDMSVLEGLHAIICLSDEQVAFFRGCCSSPVIKTKHGVQLSFFSPMESERTDRREPRLLFVGLWLRDFDTLEKAMQIVWREEPAATLDCVIPYRSRNESALQRLARDPRVRWHAELSAEALRDLYQSSDLLFLPMIDATANNAIVEALGCGLPVVTSRVGGIPQYVPLTVGMLCPVGDAAAHADAAVTLLRDRERLELARVAARRFAEAELNWSKIANSLVRDLAEFDRLPVSREPIQASLPTQRVDLR